MNSAVKGILIGLFVIGAILFAGYVGYRLYNYAVADATAKIKEGVSEGVTEGIGKGIGGALNPLKLPGKILGFGK